MNGDSYSRGMASASTNRTIRSEATTDVTGQADSRYGSSRDFPVRTRLQIMSKSSSLAANGRNSPLETTEENEIEIVIETGNGSGDGPDRQPTEAAGHLGESKRQICTLPVGTIEQKSARRDTLAEIVHESGIVMPDHGATLDVMMKDRQEGIGIHSWMTDVEEGGRQEIVVTLAPARETEKRVQALRRRRKSPHRT